MIRDAACQCGALILRCEGEPAMVSLCHCLACQRRTGSLFGVAAFYPRTALSVVSGEARQFRRVAESGSGIAFHFCPSCGSSVWWEPDRMPGMTAVAVGAFADPGFPPPRQATWDDHRHSWLTLPAEMPRHGRSVVRPPARE